MSIDQLVLTIQRNGLTRFRAKMRPLSVWFAALFAVGTLATHQWLAVRYLRNLDQIAAGQATPLRCVGFGFAADAQTWIRHALELSDSGALRLRYTADDNAPQGRPVHWNSGWAWVIADAGKLRQAVTGEPLATATERASRWLNFVVLLGAIAVLAGWAAWRFGGRAAAFVCLGIAASGRFYEGFAAGYVDHHGLLSASVLALVLGALGMLTPALSHAPVAVTGNKSRASAVFSATAGAVGLWLSAASIVPPITLVGVCAILTVVATGRSSERSATFDGRPWRVWGAVGGGLSLAFYLLEYFPHHLGWRLEVNHPVYALPWLAGAEIVAQFGERWPTRGPPNTAERVRLVIACLGVILPLLIIAVRGPAVFAPLNPFLAALHRQIAEFKSVWESARLSSVSEVFAMLDPAMIVLVASPLIFGRRKLDQTAVFTILVAVVFVGMGLWQQRWLLNASGPLILLTWAAWDALRDRPRAIRAIGRVGIAAILLVPPVMRIVQLERTLESREFTRRDAMQPLYRDIAAAIRRSQPQGEIILLSSPNASTSISYYGQFRSIGTLYWENAAGLEAAARIFSAATADEAAKLIAARRITHVAMISQENFLEPYFELLHPDDKVGFKKSFGYQLLVAHNIPSWLQILPYRVPPELAPLNIQVLLFKVAIGQTLAEGLYHLAVAQMAWSAYDSAADTLQRVIALVPNSPALWSRMAEVEIARQRWPDALAAVEKAVALAPPEERAQLYRSAAKAMQTAGAPAPQAALLRSSLALAPSPETEMELAWLLATSADASVRNAAEALKIATKLANADPDSVLRQVALAAALAESGRFTEAARVQDAAIQKSGAAGDALARLNQQLAAYRDGRPWRE